MDFVKGMLIRFKPMAEQLKLTGGSLDYIKEHPILLTKVFVVEWVHDRTITISSTNKEVDNIIERNSTSFFKTRFTYGYGEKEEVE